MPPGAFPVEDIEDTSAQREAVDNPGMDREIENGAAIGPIAGWRAQVSYPPFRPRGFRSALGRVREELADLSRFRSLEDRRIIGEQTNAMLWRSVGAFLTMQTGRKTP